MTTWWNAFWNPKFGGHQEVSPMLPTFMTFMQIFWTLGLIHYGFMLDGAPHQIRTWHKVGAICATAIGSRLVYYSPGSIAWVLFAAKVPGLIESLLTVNHARGIYYTKWSVYIAVFGTVFNSVMRFIVEPVLLWNVVNGSIALATPLDIVFGAGSVGLLGIHWVFSIRAVKGLPKLLSKFNAVQQKASKNN